MDKLSKAQKDEYAVSFAALALYDGDAEISSAQITALLEATGNTEVEAFYPIIFANFLTADKISELITSPTPIFLLFDSLHVQRVHLLEEC